MPAHTTRLRGFAAAAVALTATLTLTTPPASADGVEAAGVAHDAVNDAVGTKEARKGDVKAFEVTTLTAKEQLTDAGRLFHQAVLDIGDPSRVAEAVNVKVKFTIKVDGATPAKAVVVAHTDKPETFTVNGDPVVCRDLSFTVHPQLGHLKLTYPAACVPGDGKITIAAALTASMGGGAQVTDAIGATTPATMDGSVFSTATRSDAGDDVTYLIDPATNRYIAKSADLRNVRVAAAEDGGVQVQASVLDLSTRAYDPDQTFKFTFRNAENTLVTVVAVADPALRGEPIPAGCGTATFPRKGNTVTLDVPAACLADAPTVTVGVRTEVHDADGNLAGHDSTEPTRLVRLS